MAGVNNISGGGANISQTSNTQSPSQTKRVDTQNVNETRNTEEEKKVRRDENNNQEDDDKRVEKERRKDETSEIQASSARDTKVGTNIDKLV